MAGSISSGAAVGARKVSDQAVVSSTVMVDDTDLQIQLEANTSFRFFGRAYFNLAGIVSGYKFGLSGPASPDNVMFDVTVKNGTAGTDVQFILLNTMASTVGGVLAVAGGHVVEFNGSIDVGASSGFLKFQFAQNTSSVSAITVKRGSWMKTDRY